MKIFPRLLAAAFFCLSTVATASEVPTWSTVSDNNNQTPPNGWPEGMQYSQVNNAAREMMGAIARQLVDMTSTTAAGSSNAYALTPARTISAYTSGLEFAFIAPFTNTGASTVAVGLLSAVNLLDADGNALPSGAIIQGARYEIRYVGSAFRVMTPLILDSVTSTDTKKAASAAAVKKAFDGGFSTGDVKCSIKNAADSGWVLANDGTIGSASSSATTRANADTQALYTLLWNNVSNTYAPVSGGRGASAAADFAANKTIKILSLMGRVIGAVGAGSGLTSRALGEITGEERHALTGAENGPHTHTSAGGTTGFIMAQAGGVLGSPGSGPDLNIVANTASSGSGTPHNTMQPTTFLTCMIKL